jgi:CheY-like chemotaxis protein
MNLCTNAVHAMPAGGRLEIRLEAIDVQVERDLTLGKLRPGHWIRVSISDCGMGMTDEQLGTVFEPFYTTRKHEQGTGIGLTVVRNIILTTNGALEVESRLGAGTRMSVYWPGIDVSAGPRESMRVPGRGQTIMVVDDEAELVTVAEEVLASLGYEPVGFADSGAALEAFRHAPRRFDAVLTDDRMAILRGIDFAMFIHQIVPDIPVILMTGHRDIETDQRAREVGIAEVLDKPLRVETLRMSLGRQLQHAAT